MEKTYTPSRAVELAKEAAENQKKKKPGAYSSRWQTRLDTVMEGLLNREPFRYDLSGDALYRQYREAALRDGKLAMLDTQGQAAALTGGYGNSYAQTVGQQAYTRQMQTLNDKIPELYALALEQYDRQGKTLESQYQLLSGREQLDYDRYRDTLGAWQAEADRLQKAYDSERDFDYGAFRDRTKDEQWQAEFDEALRRYEQEWAFKQAEAEAAKKPQGGSRGGGSQKAAESPYEKALRESLELLRGGASYQTISGYLDSAAMFTGLTQEDIRSITRKVTDERDSRKSRKK